MSDDRMQHRRDRFLMETDELPRGNPNRWLVIWKEARTGGTGWATYDDQTFAFNACISIRQDGDDARSVDLDGEG